MIEKLERSSGPILGFKISAKLHDGKLAIQVRDNGHRKKKRKK